MKERDVSVLIIGSTIYDSELDFDGYTEELLEFYLGIRVNLGFKIKYETPNSTNRRKMNNKQNTHMGQLPPQMHFRKASQHPLCPVLLISLVLYATPSASTGLQRLKSSLTFTPTPVGSISLGIAIRCDGWMVCNAALCTEFPN